MSLAPRSTFFEANELLADLPREVVARLAAASDAVKIGRRGRIWARGEPVDHVYWIRSGVVKVSTELDGRELTIAFYAKGALVGEAVVSQARRATLAEAHEETALYVTPAAALEQCVDQHPRLGRRIAALLARRHERVQARLGALLLRGSLARVATVLLDLAHDFGVRDSRGVIVNLKLAHRELAALVGSTRETVSLALLELRRAGLVEAEGKRLVLLDPARLAAVAAEAPSPRSPTRAASGSDRILV